MCYCGFHHYKLEPEAGLGENKQFYTRDLGFAFNVMDGGVYLLIFRTISQDSILLLPTYMFCYHSQRRPVGHSEGSDTFGVCDEDGGRVSLSLHYIKFSRQAL